MWILKRSFMLKNGEAWAAKEVIKRAAKISFMEFLFELIIAIQMPMTSPGIRLLALSYCQKFRQLINKPDQELTML